MTNTKALRELVAERGLKYQYIAKQLNITPYGLKLKIDNVNDFKSGEIVTLCKILGISTIRERENIFFATM